MLSQEDKKNLLSAIRSRIHHFDFKWFNSIEADVKANHVWQDILYRVLLSSISVFDDLPEMEKTISYIYELWLAKAPIFGGSKGGWSNGISYMFSNGLTLLEIPALFKDFTGINFHRHSFYTENIDYIIHAFPPHSTPDGFGNGTESKLSSGLSHVAYVDACSRVFNNPYASWYAEKCLEDSELELFQDKEYQWFRIRRGYEMEKPDPVESYDKPMARVSQDVGVVSMHTDLNNISNNLMVSMRSGLNGTISHMHSDQNCFTIAYGGKRLFFNTGYKVSFTGPHTLGWFKHTQGHNGILIDGEGQPVNSDEAWGWIPRFINGRQIAYCVGDASNAYKSVKQDLGLTNFKRHLLLLRPGIVVIYDELEANHAVEWSWLIHSDEEIQVDNVHHTIKTTILKAEGFVNLYGSVPLDFSLTDKFAVEPVNFRRKVDKDGNPKKYENQWHFKATNSIKQNSFRFFAIVQVLPKSEQQSVVKNKKEGSYEIGDWVITAEMDPDKMPILEVENKNGTVSFTSIGQLQLNGQSFKAKSFQSSKLIEVIDGKTFFREVSDSIPQAIKIANSQNK